MLSPAEVGLEVPSGARTVVESRIGVGFDCVGSSIAVLEADEVWSGGDDSGSEVV